MKIVLLGEMSSLHKYLKEGLQELGHDVVLASSGDGYKKIGGQDIILPAIQNKFSVSEKFKYFISLNKIMDTLRGYDVAQIIFPNLFSPLVNTFYMKKLKKYNGILSLEAAGSDYAYFRAYKEGSWKYHAYNFYKPSNYIRNSLKGNLQRKSAVEVERLSDVIIPALYDYRLGYKTEKIVSVVPFPINVKNIEYRDNIVKNKIVFFHGLNKEVEKGTSLIKNALERLKDKYPNDVDVVVDGYMPFAQYVELMQRVNVVVDQTYGYGYGINACIALAQGKIVVSPCKQEQIEAMNASFNPFVSIEPDADDIFKKLCYIVENRSSIHDMGENGRLFVESYHDHVKIAEKYICVWKGVKK